jgi:hypothetical protein
MKDTFLHGSKAAFSRAEPELRFSMSKLNGEVEMIHKLQMLISSHCVEFKQEGSLTPGRDPDAQILHDDSSAESTRDAHVIQERS